MPGSKPDQIRYEKLPGQGSQAVQYVRLYLGPDHLLQVTSSGFTETYQRYYFQDIQAIAYYHTVLGRIMNSILAGAAGIIFLGGLATGEPGAMIGFGIVSMIILIPLLFNLAQGPTCYCYLTTAVQTVKLPSLGRMPRAQRIIERLQPLIAAAQGDWPAGAPGANPADVAPPPPPASSTSSSSLSPPPSSASPPDGPAGGGDAPPVLDHPA